MYKLPIVQDMFAMLSQDGVSLIHFQYLIWPMLSFNCFWMKSRLNYLPSTLEKVYLNPSDCVLV